MKKLALIAGLAALGLAAAAVAGVGRPDTAHGTASPAKGTIEVSATGTVHQAPDQADLSFGVSTQSDTAKVALAENSDSAQKLIDALKNAGVKSKDIQTDSVSLSPHYSNDGDTIVGYDASNSVNVSADIGDAGSLIDTASQAGANQISGPSLSVRDQDGLYNDALKKAVAAARVKAEAIAGAAGVTVGNVTSVEENAADTSPGPMMYAAASAKTAAPIEAGTQDIQASVTVTFAIG